MTLTRLRDFGLSIGRLSTGRLNAITDVPGVRVGHTTLISGEGALIPGIGPVRTGVTVILPHDGNIYQHKVRAAAHSLNGHSKVVGLEQVRELGVIETPIALTNTLNVGIVADALISYVLRQPGNEEVTSINPIVGETNDSFLNDVRGRHVKEQHVWSAIEAASPGMVQEGVVGAGTGTSCFGWKGGIGTSSRVLPEQAGGYTVGALVQSNYGEAADLTICGVPVGSKFQPPEDPQPVKTAGGSIMLVLATDAPMISLQLHRLCVRAGIGLGRTGGIYGHTSGDVVIAFSTAQPIAHQPEHITRSYDLLEDERTVMSHFFHAVADAVEEAIINSLFQARTVFGQDNHERRRLPVDEVVSFIKSCLPER
jgi:D-aminopeptidase